MYRVVIVEDKKVIRNQICSFVEEYVDGFTVIDCFADGGEAIEFLKNDTCDVIVTDVKMNSISGLDLAKYVYENNLPIKIIIISGYQEFAYVQTAMNYNVYCYLTKPTDPLELRDTFARLRLQLLKGGRSIGDVNKITLEASENNDDENKIIEKALNYLENNFGNDVTLKSVADSLYISEDYFGRIFKKRTGMNFSICLMTIRMENAKKLLGTGLYTVNEISEMVGYSNANYFIRVFKNYTGHTPKKYLISLEGH